MAYVISISNGKGGVAKTTTSIALGSSLAEMGHRVLLIDLDHNASLTLGFGRTSSRPETFSKDLFAVSRQGPIKCTHSDQKNLDLIPSNGDLVSLDARTLSLNNSATVLRLAIKTSLASLYDFILIDCPASLAYLTYNALTAADLVIIPTQAEFFSAYALQNMFQLIRNVRENKNPKLEYRILVTLLDLRLSDHLNILNQLRKHLGESLFKTMISVDTNFRKSHTNGVPINHLAPTTRGSLQYRELAQEFLEVLKKDSEEPWEGAAHQTEDLSKVALDQANQSSTNSRSNGGQPLSPGNPLSVSPVEFPPEERKNGKALFCSYLGGVEDPQTMLAYPSNINKCHYAKPVASPSLDHQNIYCLSKNHSTCPLLQDQTKRSLPSHLRAPMDATEKLQYVKSWIRAKIS